MNIKFRRPRLLVSFLMAALVSILLGAPAASAEKVLLDNPILASDHSVDVAGNTTAILTLTGADIESTTTPTGTDVDGTDNAGTTDPDSTADQSDSVDTTDNTSATTPTGTDVDGTDNAEITDPDSTADQSDSVDTTDNTSATTPTGTDVDGADSAETTDPDSAADQSDSVDATDNTSATTPTGTDVDGADNAETTDPDSTIDQTQPVDTPNNIEVTTVPESIVVTENIPPIADEQSVTTDRYTNLEITLTGSDPGEGELTFSIVTEPQQGTLNVNGSTVTYVPSLDYVGNDSFTFKVNNGETDSNITTVNITVTDIIDTWDNLNEDTDNTDSDFSCLQ